MRQQHHHHQLDQKSVRGATSLTFAEKFDPSFDTMNKIPTKAKANIICTLFVIVKCRIFWTLIFKFKHGNWFLFAVFLLLITVNDVASSKIEIDSSKVRATFFTAWGRVSISIQFSQSVLLYRFSENVDEFVGEIVNFKRPCPESLPILPQRHYAFLIVFLTLLVFWHQKFCNFANISPLP